MKRIPDFFHSEQGVTRHIDHPAVISAQSASGTEVSLLQAANSLRPEPHLAALHAQTKEVL